MVISWRAADPKNPSPQGANAVRLYGHSCEVPKDLTGLELVAGLDRDAPRPEMRIEGAIAATDVPHDVVAAALGEQHARSRGEPFKLAAHHYHGFVGSTCRVAQVDDA